MVNRCDPNALPRIGARYRCVLVWLVLLATGLAGCGGASVSRTTRRDRVHAGAVRADVPTGRSDASRRCRDILPLIQRAASETRIDPALLVGIVRTESNFRNDVRSSASAIGLTQVLPSTARAKKCGNLSDAYENLLCGSRVLVAFLDHYRGDLVLGLSGYNAGHASPDKARKRSELPSNVDYVEDVLWARAVFLSRGCDF